MAVFKNANNAVSRLAAGITAASMSAALTPGTGLLFPSLGAGEYFIGTLTNAAGTLVEIVKVTARSSDAITIVRAQEGTTALDWPISSSFVQPLTAGQLAALLQTSLLLTALGNVAGAAGTFLMSNGPGELPTWEYIVNSLPPPGMVDLGYQQITDLNSVASLTLPTGATLAYVAPQDGNVRWLTDGGNPSAGVGNIIWGTSSQQFAGAALLAAARFINMTGSTAILNVQYYGAA